MMLASMYYSCVGVQGGRVSKSCLCVIPCHPLQEVYHSTHQCFYSRRSMYLALFRLIDGEKGIDELDKWLKSVKVSDVQ